MNSNRSRLFCVTFTSVRRSPVNVSRIMDSLEFRIRQHYSYRALSTDRGYKLQLPPSNSTSNSSCNSGGQKAPRGETRAPPLGRSGTSFRLFKMIRLEISGNSGGLNDHDQQSDVVVESELIRMRPKPNSFRFGSSLIGNKSLNQFFRKNVAFS